MEERTVSRKTAMSNASFSLKMEGFSVEDEYKKLCEKLLKIEITFEEYYKLIAKMQGLSV